jgi:hypothetical protein
MIKSRRMCWEGYVARTGEVRNAYTIFIGNSEGKRPRGRPMHRWEDNIRMDLREIGCECVNRIKLVLDRDR